MVSTDHDGKKKVALLHALKVELLRLLSESQSLSSERRRMHTRAATNVLNQFRTNVV